MIPDLARSSQETVRPVGIVHVGPGPFHRAHQAAWTDLVDVTREWGIHAIAARERATPSALARQGGLYTSIERGPDGDSARLIDVVSAVSDSPSSLPRSLSDETVRVVTVTVTEAAWHLDAAGRVRLPWEVREREVAALRAGSSPTTVLATLVAALERRYLDGAAPIAIVPCDNIPDNARTLHAGLYGLADAAGLSSSQWIRDEVSFVDTCVDRITPRPTDQDVRDVEALCGWRDEAVVVTEPFAEWTMSGTFPAGRPQWERAGARFVDDISAYTARKLRLLNGAHTLLALEGLVRGFATVAETITHSAGEELVGAFWDDAVATLPGDVETIEYRAQLIARFQNPRLPHRLEQIAVGSTDKLRLRVVPVLRALREQSKPAGAVATALGLWIALARRGVIDESAVRIADQATPGGRGHATAAALALLAPDLADDADLVVDVVNATAAAERRLDIRERHAS